MLQDLYSIRKRCVMRGVGAVAQAKSAVSKVQNAVGDSAGLPSPQEAADKLKGKVDEVGRNVQGAGSNNPLSGNVPSPQEVRARRAGAVVVGSFSVFAWTVCMAWAGRCAVGTACSFWCDVGF